MSIAPEPNRPNGIWTPSKRVRWARLNVRRMLLNGDPASQIVELARQEHVDLIAMPTHGYGPFRRFILGSNTAKVLHDADCPVWTGVHIEEALPMAAPFSKILCAVDLGPQSARALAWASWLQQQFHGHLTLIHAIAAHAEALDEPDLSWRTGIREIAEEELLRLQREIGRRGGSSAGSRRSRPRHLLGGRARGSRHRRHRTRQRRGNVRTPAHQLLRHHPPVSVPRGQRVVPFGRTVTVP